jgi:hypothetical protein
VIPNEAKNQFQEIITHEMFEMDRALGGVMAATQSNASSRGVGTSGPAMQALTQDATNSLKARAQFILGQLLRCLAAHHVVMTPDTLADASNLLRDAIQTQAQLVRGRLFGNAVFAIQNLAAARQQLQAQYDQEGPRLVGRLTTELKLVAAASATPTTSSSSAPSFTFHGPVGVVQTGDGSQATVHQHVGAGIRSQISLALQGVLEQLDKPESNSIGNRAELRELVAEAKAEAEKPAPNTLKLGASLRTIVETTKFVGSLGPAYQVLKPLLSYFGIHLP